MGLQSTIPHKSSHATGGSDPLTPSAIGAATAEQGAKADSALQPSALTPYRTSAAQDLIDAGKATTNFQPSPEYLADSVSDALFSQNGYGSIRLEKGFYSDGSFFYRGAGIELNQGGAGGTWLLYQTFDDAGSFDIARSTNVTTYPWQATWPAGTSVSKYQLPRVVSPLAATAAEGTSAYAARADHVHPFPTAAQIGAAPAGNYVTLDGTGKISSTLLPSYVDDVLEYATLSALQADTTARVSGKIYVIRDSGKIYRWSGGTLFIEISNSLELQNLMLPDSVAQISILWGGVKTLSVSGVGVDGKNNYYLREGTQYWTVYWTGSMWVAAYDYDDSDFGGESPNQKSSSNTQYPWQATGWVDYGMSGGVSRVGTYNAALAPKPLAAQATSGVGAKAAREDHVHPLPTPAAIGAVSTTDPRLSDSRTPTNHKSTHATGGADALSPADIGALAATSAVDSPAAIVPSSALSGLWVNYDDLLLTPNAALTQYSASFGNLTSGGWDSKLVKNANNSWTWTHMEKSGPSTPITTRTVTSTSAGVYPYAVTWPTDNWFQSPNAITAGPMQKLAGVNLSSLNNSGATYSQVATWDGTAWVPQTPEKVIELTEAEYAALTPAQVDQTATYLVKGSATQNSTSYVGKEFG